MTDLVCAPFDNDYILINRKNLSTVKLDADKYNSLAALISGKLDITPGWVHRMLDVIGYIPISNALTTDDIVLRRSRGLTFKRASFEITENCNYKCVHCYLGKKQKGSLPLDKQKSVLDFIEGSGCVWLQMTGGEPLLDPNFFKLYMHAYSIGLVVDISTNGSLLYRSDVIELFSSYPPRRVAVSLYGASDDSYRKMTKTNTTFDKVILGLNMAREAGVRLRINIILSKFNQDEIDEMHKISESIGIDCHVYRKLQPTIESESEPINYMVSCREYEDNDEKKRSDKLEWVDRCHAGKKFYHVDAIGNASICKIARKPSVNLLSSGIDGLSELGINRRQNLKSFTMCSSCPSQYGCKMCPPLLSLYDLGGTGQHTDCPSFNPYRSYNHGETTGVRTT